MEIELGHTNYQLGELGKDGVRLTSITPEPQQLGVTVTDIAKYQVLADAGEFARCLSSADITDGFVDSEEGNSPDNVVNWCVSLGSQSSKGFFITCHQTRHYDSYPFVCVVMLSDVSQMIGGETALQVSFVRFLLRAG
jgi:hypothetical protein